MHNTRQALLRAPNMLLLTLLIFTALLLMAGCGKRPNPAHARTATAVAVIFSNATSTHAAGAARLGETPLPPNVATETTSPLSAAATPGGVTLTPTRCKPPASWIVYTLLPGDTLFWLAQNTGSTVEEIKKGNCKADDNLIAYEEIYLPKRPPTPVPLPPQPPQPADNNGPNGDECASIFSCANEEVDAMSIYGTGGNFDYTPCSPPNSKARIDSPGLSSDPPDHTATMGERSVYYACDFSSPGSLTAYITGQGQNLKLDVVDANSLPAEALPQNIDEHTKKVIIWYPVCDLPEGDYTLTVTDGIDMKEEPVNLRKQPNQQIMVKPFVIKKGDPFKIYYCGYTNEANQDVEMQLFWLRLKDETDREFYNRLRIWTVKMNGSGWAEQDQPGNPNASPGKYDLRVVLDTLMGKVNFWVMP